MLTSSELPEGLSPKLMARVVAASSVDVRSLDGAHVLMTGGTGFVGSWLTLVLATAARRASSSVHITVLTRDPIRAARNDWLRSAGADLIQLKQDGPLAGVGEVSHIIHMATPTTVADGSQSPMSVARADVGLLLRLADLCASLGRPPRLLNVSSGAVYKSAHDPSGASPFSEESARTHLDASDGYRLAKQLSESITMEIAGTGLALASTARLFAFMGARLPTSAHFAIGNFVSCAVEKGLITIRGSGTNVRSYQHGGDLAHWLIRILATERSGEVVNVGSDEAKSLSEWAGIVAGATGARIEVLSEPATMHDHYVPDLSRAVSDYGLRNTVVPSEAIAEWIVWLGRRGAPGR